MDKASIKAKLEARRAELASRIDDIERDLKKTHSQDFAEQVTERENEEVLQGLLAEARQERQSLRTALERIDSGDYGTCRRCGEPIDERRLAARPEASTCIGCAA